MALSPPEAPVLLLRMVRWGDMPHYVEYMDRVRSHAAPAPVKWVTTRIGHACLRLELQEEQFLLVGDRLNSPGKLRQALRSMNALQPDACVLWYENEKRKGNLSLELLALFGAAPRIEWTPDGYAYYEASRVSLAFRVVGGAMAAAGRVVVGMGAAVLIAAALPLLTLFARPARPGPPRSD